MNEAIFNRRSIRKYRREIPVTEKQMQMLIEAAMLAPSTWNSRPWEFIVITKREVLDEIVNIHPYAKMCETAAAAIIIVALPQKGTPAEGYYPQDCAVAAQNILLQATSMDLGACWCGIYPREDRVTKFRKLFDIDEQKIPFCILAVGTPDESPDRRGFYDDTKVTYIS